MGENSNIEWTDHTFNPWIGCTKVSAACDHCYAETWDKRFNGERWGPHAARTRTSAANWRKPLAWDRQAAAEGVRRRVFCASLADVFDNHKSIEPEWRDDLWKLIANTPNLDWLLLTKRPQNIKRFLPDEWQNSFWPGGRPNVWLGTTVENQEEADRRIPHLLSVPAVVRFLSCEPLLGPVDLGQATRRSLRHYSYLNLNLHWVICGGESGPNARPMHPDWARSLRDQCAAAGVAFHFKQWGEWLPGTFGPAPELRWQGKGPIWEANHFPADMDNDPKWDDGLSYIEEGEQTFFYKAGKKAAGRLLDGVEHNGLPEVAA